MKQSNHEGKVTNLFAAIIQIRAASHLEINPLVHAMRDRMRDEKEEMKWEKMKGEEVQWET